MENSDKYYYMQLCHDLDEKNVEITKLQNEANKIKEKIENIRSNFIDIAKGKLLNKWFITKSPKESYSRYYFFGYCTKVHENGRDASFEYKGNKIYADWQGRIYYQENSIQVMINTEELNEVLILTEDDAKEINEAIAETVKGGNSVKDLYNCIEEIYNKKRHEN